MTRPMMTRPTRRPNAMVPSSMPEVFIAVSPQLWLVCELRLVTSHTMWKWEVGTSPSVSITEGTNAQSAIETSGGGGVHPGQLPRARGADAHRRQVVRVRDPCARRREDAALQRAAQRGDRHQPADVDRDAARAGAGRARDAHDLPRGAAPRGVRAHDAGR